jgi:hypothetical protein
VTRLRDVSNVNFADIVDPVPEHGETFQAITDAHGGVPRWIAAEMAHDSVRENTTSKHFDPLPVLVDLKLPCTRAHPPAPRG